MLLGIVTLLVAQSAFAQTVTLTPALNAGDAFALGMSKARERMEGGRTIFRGRAETPVDVRVVEASTDGWVVDWTFGETRVVEPADVPPPPDAALFNGVTLRLRLDRTGRPRAIENYTEVRQRIDAATAALLQSIPDSVLRDRLAVFLREALGSREQIEQMLLGDIGVYFLPYSAPLDRSQPRKREVEIASPVGGKPLKAIDEFTLVRYEPQAPDATARTAVIQWTQTMDPAEVARMMRDVEKHVRERSNVPPGAAQPALPASIDARADGRYEVALDGLRLPVVAEVQRRTSSGSVVMADTLRYARTR